MERKTMESLSISKLQKLIEDTDISNITYRYDSYDNFTLKNGEYIIDMTYRNDSNTVKEIMISRQETETYTLPHFKKSTSQQRTVNKQILILGHEQEDKIYPEFWKAMSELLPKIKKQIIDDKISKALGIIEEPEKISNIPTITKEPDKYTDLKKSGYTSRMCKASSLIEGESK